MSTYITATELLLGAGDFLTIYLFGYMQRTFCEIVAMIAAYMIPLFLIYHVKSFRDLTNF